MATVPPSAAEGETLEAPSLFPLFLQHSPTSLPIDAPGPGDAGGFAVQNWLCNTSFTADASAINADSSSRHEPKNFFPSDEEEGSGERIHARIGEKKPIHELVGSSESDTDSDGRRRRRRKKKKMEKRKNQNQRHREANASHEYEFDPSSRKPNVQSWASTSTSSEDKDYYFDSRGDRDNMVFGCLYRMDVARYKLYHSTNSPEFNHLPFYRWNQSSWGFDRDSDVNALDNKLKSEGRYWSAKYAALERHKNFKRMRIVAPKKFSSNIEDDFIPLSYDGMSGSASDLKPLVAEESWEDEVLRKTREFNKMTREQPHNEKIWLAFAEFQDEVASMQPHKGARLQTLEKKISILEKAAELNPDNEDLLISLMNGYQSRDGIDVFIGRWEKLLMNHSGSYKLWRQFLRVLQGDFSRFKVSEVRKMYANAIRALFGACSKQHRQVNQTAVAPCSDPIVIQQELGLVDIFVSLCRFEWQAGYKELATALFQAEIEYSLFGPSLFLTEQGKRRLFEHFWDSNGLRIGEDGALGWSTWLEKEEEQRQKVIIEESSGKLDEGGWTGWFEPKSNDPVENVAAAGVAAENNEDEPEAEDVEEENDDTEALLKMLGVDADSNADVEVKDPTTWCKWSKVELSRDSDQWIPVRSKSGVSHGDGTVEREGDEQLLRVILYEDVNDYLFSLSSEDARLSLVFQFIDFYGASISQWSSTNSSNWAEKTHSLESLSDPILDDLRRIKDILTKTEDNQSCFSLEDILGNSDEVSMSTKMVKFVRNASLLCFTVFQHGYILKEALLVAEEQSNTAMDSHSSSVTPCRQLAKTLLKSNRQDVLLCGVYARREAAFGNIDLARRVFDMALSYHDSLPSDSRSNMPLLFFWYAEVELANGSDDSTSEPLARALHILSCLGCGMKYSFFKGQPSSLQLLRARQGFKEQIRMLQATWIRGVIDDSSFALICSAALFEELTTGLVAAMEVLNQAFSMVLPEKRSQTHQLELLLNFNVKMLWKHRAQSKLAKVWDSVVHGLEIYPFNPKLYGALVEIGILHTSPGKLRWMLDDFFKKKPSVTLCIFALSLEISRGSSRHRVHGLFERALANNALRSSVLIWRLYMSYEISVAGDLSAARRVYFRAIHACPWSKSLWLDGFLKLNSVLTAKELADLQEVMRDKELNIRTDIYEILLQDEMEK